MSQLTRRKSGKRAVEFCNICGGGGSEAVFIKGACIDCYVNSIGYQLIPREGGQPPEWVKERARNETNKAIEAGILIRPLSCDKCKRFSKIVAHHEDYSSPLDVDWLCESCHAKIHYSPFFNKEQVLILSNIISELRKSTKLSVYRLSRKLDLSDSTIHRLEKQDGSPSLVTALKIYDFFKSAPFGHGGKFETCLRGILYAP